MARRSADAACSGVFSLVIEAACGAFSGRYAGLLRQIHHFADLLCRAVCGCCEGPAEGELDACRETCTAKARDGAARGGTQNQRSTRGDCPF